MPGFTPQQRGPLVGGGLPPAGPPRFRHDMQGGAESVYSEDHRSEVYEFGSTGTAESFLNAFPPKKTAKSYAGMKVVLDVDIRVALDVDIRVVLEVDIYTFSTCLGGARVREL